MCSLIIKLMMSLQLLISEMNNNWRIFLLKIQHVKLIDLCTSSRRNHTCVRPRNHLHTSDKVNDLFY